MEIPIPDSLTNKSLLTHSCYYVRCLSGEPGVRCQVFDTRLEMGVNVNIKIELVKFVEEKVYLISYPP